jgi:hypothetical protein
VRSGTSFRLYQNGVQSTNGATSSDAVANNSTAINIGSFIGSAISNLNGNISNLRILKGTALYTSNFTPSTSPLTAIANTSLLTCQSATIIDNSTNNFAITNNNAATVSSINPFRAPINNFQFARRTSKAVGNSVLFNGSNQYLSIGRILDNSTDVTIEAWVRVTSTPTIEGKFIVSQYVAGGANRTIFYISTTLTVGMQIGSAYGESATAITLNTWYHLAWVRSGSGANNFSIYINGTRDGQMTYTGTFQNTPTTIGGSNNYDVSGNSYFTGYISNLRILKGTALYTSNFTTPTAPLTTIANTALLTCNADTIFDSSTNNFTITNNNTATVSSITPFVVSGGGMSLKQAFADPNAGPNPYMIATGGDLITTSGSYKIHTFTTVGTSSFTISSIDSNPSIEYLVVGGGGGGGYAAGAYDSRGGGGGAGGFRTGSISSGFTNGTYSIVVGSGGSLNNNGQDSSFLTVTSLGGGGGGFGSTAAKTGGSGGGGGAVGGAGNYAGAAGTAGQGNSGGGGGTDSATYRFSGGGGGAGSAGVTAVNSSTACVGGSGSYSNITGTNTPYAGGGGGAYHVGGIGGGGAGMVTGSANTGGGGGGGYTTYQYVNYPGGTGGSGIVIIKYRYTA